MSELEIAQKAARAGGEVVATYFREGVSFRSNEQAYNLVSDADIESEAVIARIIKETFPDHEILGEETHRGDPRAPHLWVVDPLDGTSNFAHRIPQFAVSVAYYEHGQAACGVVFNPVLGDWFVATRGQGGLFQRSERLCGAAPAVGRGADFRRVFLPPRRDCGCHAGGHLGPSPPADPRGAAVRQRGARDVLRRLGDAQRYFEYELSPWDFAAGRLFVEEAGGRVTTCQGPPLPLAKTSLLATNGRLHEAILEILRAHEPTA